MVFVNATGKNSTETATNAPKQNPPLGQPITASTHSTTTSASIIITTPAAGSAATSSTTIRPSNTTKIIGFSDGGYMEYAFRWYEEMTKLGYTEHLVVAQDKQAQRFFQSKGMRHDWIHEHDERLSNITIREHFRRELCSEYDGQFTIKKQDQVRRRSLFGNRWTYVLRQLERGYNVLLTDVDNVFTQYRSLVDLEESEYDSYHAYAGTVPSFPRNIFAKTGFTICGGMSWLRSSPGVMEIAQTLVDRCDCNSTLNCNCNCDDQVTINTLLLVEEAYKVQWDPPHYPKPNSEDEMTWNGRTGVYPKTGHKVKIWDRHTAFRRNLDPNVCPDPARNWIAMPTKVDRGKVWDEWNRACPPSRPQLPKPPSNTSDTEMQ
jgi:hypothetical protein